MSCCEKDCNQGRECPNRLPINVFALIKRFFTREAPKVVVYKNGVNIGWFKSLKGGINAIRATSDIHKFDISEYELRDYDNHKKILWRGSQDTPGV